MNKIGKISAIVSCVLLFAAIGAICPSLVMVYYINGDPIVGEFPYLISYIVPFMVFAFCTVVQAVTKKFRLFAAIKCVLSVAAVIVTFCFMHCGFNIYYDVEPFIFSAQLAVITVDAVLELVFAPQKKRDGLAKKIVVIAAAVLALVFIGFTPLISYHAFKYAETEYWDTHYADVDSSCSIIMKILKRNEVKESDSPLYSLRYARITSSIDPLFETMKYEEEDVYSEGKTALRSEVAEKFEQANPQLMRRSLVDTTVERDIIVFDIAGCAWLCICPDDNLAIFFFNDYSDNPEYVYIGMDCSAFVEYV